MDDMTNPGGNNELDFVQALAPLADARIVEGGCGAAYLARKRVSRHPDTGALGDQQFEIPVRHTSRDAFEQRTKRPTFIDRGIDAARA